MADRNLVLPSGVTYEVRKCGDGSLEVRVQGKKPAGSVAVKPEISAIDSTTKRIHLSHGNTRKLFWVYTRGSKRVLSWPGGSLELEASDLTEGSAVASGALKPLKLTMPGKVLSVKVKEGDIVEPGQGLVIVEAMKMENLLLNERKAKVVKVHVKEGDRLESGSVLITFGAAE